MITAVSEPLRRLALAPEPHPGESLLSWLDALARTNRVSRMQALRLAGFVRPGAPGNRPPVHFGSRVADETAERVYAATGLPPQRMHQMTLLHYVRGVLPEPPPPPLTPQSVSSWLARHRIALPTRSRACPPCLRETGGRWLLKWRLSGRSPARDIVSTSSAPVAAAARASTGRSPVPATASCAARPPITATASVPAPASSTVCAHPV